MTCIALYHVRFEDLGSFAAPIERASHAVAYRHAGASPLSDAEWTDTDLVVVLGGPIGIEDTGGYPWLQDELTGLARRLQLNKPTLGICLGAQLMARALGGGIARRTGEDGAPAMEIGWSALDLADDAGPLEALRCAACRCCIGTATTSCCRTAWRPAHRPASRRCRPLPSSATRWPCSSIRSSRRRRSRSG